MRNSKEENRKYYLRKKALLAANPDHVFGNRGRPRNTPEELWRKVNKGEPNECWEWSGFRNEIGYGRTQINGKMYYAHRVIFNLVNPGKIDLNAPKSSKEYGFVMHRCDNPPCCNPAHLLLGTHKDNMEDRDRKGRGVNFSGDKGPRCKITMEQAREARRLHFEEGVSRKEIAKIFGLSNPSVQALMVGRTYKEP